MQQVEMQKQILIIESLQREKQKLEVDNERLNERCDRYHKQLIDTMKTSAINN